jgi:2-oxo-4-hydroxy-4-carboxy--5-ureidoimidazoline (OHCU) decarboxylase
VPERVLVPPASLAALGRDELAAALRPLWEDAGPLVDRLAGRQFLSWQDLVDEAERQIGAMSVPERVALLAAHPRIGAPVVALAARSQISLAEQGGAAGAAPEVLAELDALNDRYEERFGFPFVAWVAGRSRREMTVVIEDRLGHDRATELAAGCAALVAIARDRLSTIGVA